LWLDGLGIGLGRVLGVGGRGQGDRGGIGAGVGGVVDLFHAIGGQVGVDLGGGEALVAEEFLDAAEVGAVVEQVGGEAVAEGVGADAGVEAGHDQILVELAADGAGGDGGAVFVEEDAAGQWAGRIRLAGAVFEVALEGLDGLAADGSEAVLAALAADAEDAFLHIEVGHVELDELADTDAGGVEDFEHGFIAGGEQVGVAGGIEELLDFLEFQAAGEAFFLLGGSDGGEGVDADEAAAHEELVEAAEGGEFPGRGGLGVVLAVEIGQELADNNRLAADLFLVDLPGCDGGFGRGVIGVADQAGEELPELDEIGAVALDGVIAEVSLELEVVEELLDQRGKGFGGRSGRSGGNDWLDGWGGW